MADTEVPNPIDKFVEANQKAEDALNDPHPNIELAQVWTAIAANWVAMIDPRVPEVRRLTAPKRQ